MKCPKNFYPIFLIFSIYSNGDSFQYNTYNNHGIVGLINTPTARFFDEAVHGLTFHDGTPDQKITLTSNPYEWLEASFFYTNIQGLPYPGFEFQDYKDKGFNVKLRLKEQDIFPAVAVGIMDIAGTGYYSSEYVVTSYAINNIDMHYGFGWGTLNGSTDQFKNPLGYINDGFNVRPSDTENINSLGGEFDTSRYFSGEKISSFYGASISLNTKILLKIEKDTTLTTGLIEYEKPKSDYSIGIDYSVNENFVIGLSFERGNFASVRFSYKNNPKKSYSKYVYEKAEVNENDSKYLKLIKNLENNGIGVNKIVEKANSIGLELTQFTHPNLQIVEEIIYESSRDANINKDIKKNLKIVNMLFAIIFYSMQI